MATQTRAAGNGSSTRFWRCAAAWLVFAWPCWWVARSLLEAVPSLLVSAFTPYTLAMYMLRPEGMMARVFPPGAVTADYRPGMSAALRDPFGLSLVLAIGCVSLLLAVRRRLPHCALLASLAAGSVVVLLLESAGRVVWFRSADAGVITWLNVAVGLALSVPVFRAVADDTSLRTRTGRFAALAIAFCTPGVLLTMAWGRGGSLEQSLISCAWLLPVLAVGAFWTRQVPGTTHPPGFRALGFGIAASLCVFLLGSSPRPQPRERAERPVQAAASLPPDAPYQTLFFQRGVSYTSEWPESYDSAKAHEMLAKLKKQGVDSIALVPYGVTRGGGNELRFGGWERDDSIVSLSNTAHALGMRVMLKPQVWIRGSYPGDFDLPDDESRRAWLAQYEDLALHYAELAKRSHADLFCIGTEFAKLTRHEEFWRQLIVKVRKVYPGPLTYAANFGAEFEALTFWDDLDYIGLNNYYPLPDSLNCEGIVAKVEAVQKRFDKPVIFTEGGYSSYEGGHRKPWSENEGPLDLEMQAAAYDSVLSAFWGKPWFYGAYWWKVGSNAFGGPLDKTHTPWGKPAMDVLRAWYSKPAIGRQGDLMSPETGNSGRDALPSSSRER